MPRPTVLVVDDERFIVDLLTDLLEEEGYAVGRAYDGVQARAEIERSRPDLVIADIMMPRLDGVSLVRQLRDRGDRTPVVLMSAAVLRAEGLDVPFIAKPFDIDHLLETVRDIVERSPR